MRERERERESERERDAEQGDRVTVLRTAALMILKLENPLESLEDRIAIHMNRFLCIPSFLFLFSKAAQHGPAPFAACSRGRGLSGFVTYQTREVTRCSPLPVVFVGIKLPEF